MLHRELARQNGGGNMSKYRSEKTCVDGICFDSKKEARRYCELKLMERAGEISGLELQKKFELILAQYEKSTETGQTVHLADESEKGCQLCHSGKKRATSHPENAVWNALAPILRISATSTATGIRWLRMPRGCAQRNM